MSRPNQAGGPVDKKETERDNARQLEKTDCIEQNGQSRKEGSSSKPEEQCDSDSSDNSIEITPPNLTIVLTGNAVAIQFGCDNLLLGEKQTNVENAEIHRIVPVQKKISERCVSVINMIDLHEAENVNNLVNQLVNENEIHVFIFAVQLGQLTDADKMGLKWLQRMFGDKIFHFVMILFVYEREDESDIIIDDLKKNPVLEQLLEKCGGRYQTCNNMMNNTSEMRELMNKIEHLFAENQHQHYTGEMYNTALRQRADLKKGKYKRGRNTDYFS
ncbi:hypothetical protein QQF64_024080 [Cirrhinus molitorella]|uniref:AIG1-type G domain-containing protein n=1 Tax=Cirrhinus molitorella TaxID=172907 RepID=A0ABR3NKW2_9TELE